MITCNLMGGLGNQIFKIFATMSYAIKSRNKFKFLNVKILGKGTTTIRSTYWETFFSKLTPFLILEIPPVHKDHNFYLPCAVFLYRFDCSYKSHVGYYQ